MKRKIFGLMIVSLIVFLLNGKAQIKSTYFKKINQPLNFNEQKVLNRSFSQAEYINILQWQANPDNEGIAIIKYRIYQIDGDIQSLESELTADQFEYRKRKVENNKNYNYSIVAVTDENQEGGPSYLTVR